MKTPEGWKLVPVALTEEMRNAGRPWLRFWHHMTHATREANLAASYQAMLLAAPTPPAQGQVSLPKVTPFKSTSLPESEGRNEPIDYWLRKMLENCDYHDGLVIEATLNFLGGLMAPASLQLTPDEYARRWQLGAFRDTQSQLRERLGSKP